MPSLETSSDHARHRFNSIRNDISRGLLYTHTRIGDNTRKILESTSFLYGLLELLNEKGIITIEELDERGWQVAERLVREFTESGLGLMYRILDTKVHF